MYPVEKIPFPLTVVMIFILLLSLHRVPLQLSGNGVAVLKAGCVPWSGRRSRLVVGHQTKFKPLFGMTV